MIKKLNQRLELKALRQTATKHNVYHVLISKWGYGHIELMMEKGQVGVNIPLSVSLRVRSAHVSSRKLSDGSYSSFVFSSKKRRHSICFDPTLWKNTLPF